MPTEETNNIAVLIDAENVDPAYAGHIMSYAYSLGNVCIREIYGSGISLNEWADPILAYSIHTNFTLRPNRYKNSSDICLVIGAMEILAATREGGKGAVAAVVIASSDSDFSALAVHLRSAGIDVIGMGEAGRVNPMWPRACTDFVPLEAKMPLMRKREEMTAPAAAPAQEKKTDRSPAQTSDKNQTRSTGQPNGKQGNTVVEQTEDKPGSAGIGQPAEQPADKPDNMTADQQVDKPGAAAAETGKKQQKAETDKARKKKETVRVAPTHKARMEIIRRLITEEIESHDGRVKSGDLFRVIGSNPEYKYDQQRSRRAPMDYLKTQYGMWFDFEPQENGMSLITLKEIAQPEQAEASAAVPVAGGVTGLNGDQIGEATELNGESTGEQPEPADERATEPLTDETIGSNGEQAGEVTETDKEQIGEQRESADERATEPLTEETIGSNGEQAGETTEPKEELTTEQSEPTKVQNGRQVKQKKAQNGDRMKPQKNKGGKQAEAKKAQSGTQSKPKKEQNGKTAEPKKKQSGKQTKGKNELKAKETLSPMARQLKEAGIPQQDVARVEETLAGCKNLRDSYNHLRQAFGNETGKQYQQMIKDAGIQIG